MQLNVLAKAGRVFYHPFPFVLIEDALPQRVYDELESQFPEQLICATPPLDGGLTYRYKCNPVLVEERVPMIWRDFFEYHTSPEYFHACLRLFSPYLEKHYPEILNRLTETRVSVRNFNNNTPVVTDCQFVVHEPVDQTKTSRSPHLDNPVEIYAGLLYMKSSFDRSTGGNLHLHKVQADLQSVRRSRGREVGVELCKPGVEVPYKRNTFCMFLNVKTSVHSVTPRIGAQLRRRSINIIGEFNQSGRMWDIPEVD